MKIGTQTAERPADSRQAESLPPDRLDQISVKRWIHGCPGCFRAPSADQVVRRAHAEFARRTKSTMPIPHFRTALDEAGYRPEPFRDHSSGEYVYRLALPER